MVWDAFRQEYVPADRDPDDEEEEEVKEDEEEDTETWVPLKERLRVMKEAKMRRRAEEEEEEEEVQEVKKSLVAEVAEMKKAMPRSFEEYRLQEAEARLMREAQHAQVNSLRTAKEVAENVQRREIETRWRPEKVMSVEDAGKCRKKWGILVDGVEVPPPVKHFRDMVPDMVEALEEKGITKPTPIQLQGLPVALSGRDMIGIAFTGSGKTLTFCLPLIARSLERPDVRAGEGPVGVILCPSRELARQTFEVLDFYARSSSRSVRTAVAVGGEEKRTQLATLRCRGIHGLVATPGRLIDFLNRGDVNFRRCEYFCLDEGDRMVDFGFDEDVRKVMNHFDPSKPRQTLLFSATMPQKVRDFAQSALLRPVIVNVSRAGAANLDVLQEVEYVKAEARIVYLLDCLQKTPPPVVIFSERKTDVDDILEYLLLKGVDAVAVHGGKDQSERNSAITAFKDRRADVLVATDVAAKGLDFPAIQHVINFDMPNEIEQYVHRIGRTGRQGKTGVATTFINKNSHETALLDLKFLLIEAKQRVPPVLQALQEPPQCRQPGNLDSPDEQQQQPQQRGCVFCGGLGHTIIDCPKRDRDARRLNANRRDFISGGRYGSEI